MDCDPCAELLWLRRAVERILAHEGLSTDDALTLEGGGFLLLEDGSRIILEN